MKILSRCFFAVLLVAVIAGCSSGGDEKGAAKGVSAHGPDIKGIMGYDWHCGTDAISDHSLYDVSTSPGVERFSYIGDPFRLDDYDVEISHNRFEFVDGELVGSEFVGDNLDDIEKVRTRLTEDYGEPGESSPGHYKWVSDTGTLVLDDVEDYWSLLGWSSDAPDYWN